MIGNKWEKNPANEISNDNEDEENVLELTERQGSGRKDTWIQSPTGLEN